MARIRKLIKAGWEVVNVSALELENKQTTHSELFRSVVANATGGVSATRINGDRYGRESVFAFENAGDAAMFILKVK